MKSCARLFRAPTLMLTDSDCFLVDASPAVAEALKGEESHSLAEVEIFVGKQVKEQIEPLYNQEQFDVVMM